MTLRRRLERVESALAGRYPAGRCANCCDWPAMQLKILKDGIVSRVGSYDPERVCCPQCGWTPQIHVITEVIVGPREAVEAPRVFSS